MPSRKTRKSPKKQQLKQLKVIDCQIARTPLVYEGEDVGSAQAWKPLMCRGTKGALSALRTVEQ